jgi:hypothetical protein
MSFKDNDLKQKQQPKKNLNEKKQKLNFIKKKKF